MDELTRVKTENKQLKEEIKLLKNKKRKVMFSIRNTRLVGVLQDTLDRNKGLSL